MALQMRSAVARGAARASAPRSRIVRVTAQKQDNVAQAAVAAFAVATLLQASPAMAGVVLEKPQLKKVFQDDGSAPAVSVEPPKFNWTPPVPGAKKEAPKKAAAAAKKEEKEEKYSEDSLDPRVVALPGALALVAGLAALRGENFDLVMVKDSADLGVGYEPAIPKFLPPGTKAAPLKNNKKKTTVSGKGLFGKK